MNDIYDNTLALLENFLPIDKWPEMRYLIQRAAGTQPRAWQMPIAACEAVGGNRKQALPAVASIACLQVHFLLIDDLLDEDPRGQHHHLGVAVAANLAAAFQAAAANVVAHSQANPTIRLAVLDSLHQMVQTTSLGQHLDTQDVTDENTYWDIVRSKSGSYFGTTLHIGALLGGATLDVANQLKQVGSLYGEMTQIHDDLNDSLEVPANPDWIQGRSPLPILFAEIVAHPKRSRFHELRHSISDPTALAEAQDILWRSGGISYGIDQLLRRYQKACDMLAAIPLVLRTGLEELLEEQAKPVWSLFHSMGVEEPERMAIAI
ncbi:MAG: polyprenyl synthetase family protein [Ardenticatenaceae bacterium]